MGGKQPTSASDLKRRVREYWNEAPCGASHASSPKFTRDYFEEIEAHRYTVEPEILTFARFEEARGKDVLEVGVGAGTDFLQWIRSGARAHGIDLTQEAVDHVKHRLDIYGFEAAEVRVADCEALPYDDATFDLVYCWGVIHHTPDTLRALSEIVRVCRPGGTGRIMVYNRHSVVACDLWIAKALRNFRPDRSLAWCLYHHVESEGTKAYTPAEIRGALDALPVRDVRIDTVFTCYDRLEGRRAPLRWLARGMARLLGGQHNGWFMLIEFTRAHRT